MIDVFAGRQRRDRSIGKEVKVEPKSQGIAWMPEAVRQKMKGTIHKHIITQIPKMETSWNMVCLVSLTTQTDKLTYQGKCINIRR